MSNVLYPEDAVLEMLQAAYRAGFEGPLELAEETCRELLARATYKESDLELIDYMQQRERKKEHEQGVEAIKKARKQRSSSDYSNIPLDFFDGDLHGGAV